MNAAHTVTSFKLFKVYFVLIKFGNAVMSIQPTFHFLILVYMQKSTCFRKKLISALTNRAQ